jgi:hypothetical protein
MFPFDPVLSHHVPLLNEAGVGYCNVHHAVNATQQNQKWDADAASVCTVLFSHPEQAFSSHSRNAYSLSHPTKLRWNTILWDVTPCNPTEVQGFCLAYSSTLKMEAVLSHLIPQDGTLYSHCRDNLRSIKLRCSILITLMAFKHLI